MGDSLVLSFYVLNYNLKMGAVDKVDMVNSFVECAQENYQVV